MESLPGYDAWKTTPPDIPDDCEYCGEGPDECDCWCSDCGHVPCGCDQMYEDWKDRKMREEYGID